MEHMNTIKSVHKALRDAGYSKGTARSWLGPSYRSWMSDDGTTMNVEVVSLRGSSINKRAEGMEKALYVIRGTGAKCWSFGIHVYVELDALMAED